MTESVCPCWHRKDPERPRQSAPGVLLCPGHLSGLSDNLHELARLHDELAAHLIAQGGSGEGRRTDSDETGIDLNASVVRARDHIRATLVAWTRITLEEGPWHQAPVDTLPAIARWLAVRADWLANREWTVELVDNLHETLRESRGLIQPNTTYRIELGPCPESVLVEGDEPTVIRCGGTVFAVMQRVTSAEALPSEVRCTLHGDDEEEPHAWGPMQWHALGRRMGRTMHPDAATAFIRAVAG